MCFETGVLTIHPISNTVEYTQVAKTVYYILQSLTATNVLQRMLKRKVYIFYKG